MKKLFYLLCFFTLTGAHAFGASNPADTVVIGHITGNATSFTANRNMLKGDWQNFLALHGFSGARVDQVQIVANDGQYYFVATGTQAGKKLRSSFLLQHHGGRLFITGRVVTCTTTDCASDKHAAMPHNSFCTPCSNGVQCTKIIANGPIVLFAHATVNPGQ